MPEHDLVQRTPPWERKRLGYITSTDAKVLFAKLKSGAAPAGRRDLITRLALCRLGCPPALHEGYTNADMDRGVRLEKKALNATEIFLEQPITPVGFYTHDDPSLPLGCSPDGWIGEGIVEVKCPRPSNQISAWELKGKTGIHTAPKKDHAQLTHLLSVTGKPFIVYTSYCEDIVPELRLYVTTITREAAASQIVDYEKRLVECYRDIEEKVALLTALIDQEKGRR